MLGVWKLKTVLQLKIRLHFLINLRLMNEVSVKWLKKTVP